MNLVAAVKGRKLRETSAANALNKCLLFMQFLNKEIQSPVAWSTTQSHFGFLSDLSEFGQHLVNKSQSALSKGAHELLYGKQLKKKLLKKRLQQEDAEENPEETADVEQAFNNLSTMSFLNISTRSKTTQTAKERKQLEQAKKKNLQ
nr:hypothetical protein [Tanacetum cinerariifolium]